MDSQLRKSYRFFHENAGYIVGQKAMGALQLAKAERDLFDCYGWSWQTEPDYSPDLSWMSDEERRQEHEVIGLVLVDPDGKPRYEHSLWGIVDPTNDYLRVEAANLAFEVTH